MKNISILLREEIHKLEKIVKCTRDRIQKAPQGNLRISKKKSGMEYYVKRSGLGSDNGKYIKKKDMAIVYKLAQRDYDAHILKLAEERLLALNRFIEIYEKTDLSKIYQKTNSYRRELIDDVILPDDEFVKRWQTIKYEGKTHAEDAPEIITEMGERVRSKSEKIIADKLYSLGIPYRYEYPLVLAGNIRVYPDFTILKVPAREEVYLEHLGMMDDYNYMDTVIYKLNTYAKNEIYLGVNLFITYETKKAPLNTRVLDGLVKKLFCVE